MKEILKFLLLPLLFIWELPQNMLGLLVYAIMKIKQQIVLTEQETQRIFIETPNIGVSLGWFVFWTPIANRFSQLYNDCRMHEFGHARQSVMLGPFYLIVVGIPSLSRVIYRRWYRKKYGHSWNKYFNGFPENWADKLGGVFDSKKEVTQ